MTAPAADKNARITTRTFPLREGTRGDARFSADGRHRYEIWRRRAADDAPFALFVGMNPSAGAADVDDATLVRIQGFANREGFDNVCIANAFAVRGTDPSILTRVVDAVGPDNDRTLVDLHARAGLTVAAWGDDGSQFHRDHNLRRLLAAWPMKCLGYTARGFPRHPLYVKGDATLVLYPRA